EPRRSRIENTASQPDQGLAFPGGVPNDTETRLELFPRRRNIARRRKSGFADKRREEYFAGGRNGIRLDLGVPAQPITHSQAGANLPLILREQGRLPLRQILRA